MKVVCFVFPVPTFAEQRGNKSKNGPKHLILSSTVTPDLPMSQQSCFNKLTGEQRVQRVQRGVENKPFTRRYVDFCQTWVASVRADTAGSRGACVGAVLCVCG